MEYNINFTDITMVETDGSFEKVDKIMSSQFQINKINKKIKEKEDDWDWVIRSDVTIDGPEGSSNMEVQFISNREVYILEYMSNMGNVFYNTDIKVFSMWLQENGWKIPQPSPNLVKENKEFWKYFYETLIIDSDYLDSIYGIRPSLQ